MIKVTLINGRELWINRDHIVSVGPLCEFHQVDKGEKYLASVFFPVAGYCEISFQALADGSDSGVIVQGRTEDMVGLITGGAK